MVGHGHVAPYIRSGVAQGCHISPHAKCEVRARLAQTRMRLGARARPTVQQAHSIPFASIVASMLPLPCLARHAALHLAAHCYAGAAPLCCALCGTPRNPSVPPARLAALACVVCVCVCDGVMFLCRAMCFLLSGWLSLAMRLRLRSAVLAVVVHLFSVSVLGAHVVCCSPSRLHIRCAVCCFFPVPPRPPLILARMQVWDGILCIVCLGCTYLGA